MKNYEEKLREYINSRKYFIPETDSEKPAQRKGGRVASEDSEFYNFTKLAERIIVKNHDFFEKEIIDRSEKIALKKPSLSKKDAIEKATKYIVKKQALKLSRRFRIQPDIINSTSSNGILKEYKRANTTITELEMICKSLDMKPNEIFYDNDNFHYHLNNDEYLKALKKIPFKKESIILPYMTDIISGKTLRVKIKRINKDEVKSIDTKIPSRNNEDINEFMFFESTKNIGYDVETAITSFINDCSDARKAISDNWDHILKTMDDSKTKFDIFIEPEGYRLLAQRDIKTESDEDSYSQFWELHSNVKDYIKDLTKRIENTKNRK